jgi:thiol-disulfide isomerase/thioredoxin
MNKSFALLLLLVPAWVFASSVKIGGEAADYSGRKIILFQTDDYLSGNRSVLASSEIKSDGSFELTAPLEVARELTLAIGGAEAVIHALPGASYRITLPLPGKGIFRRFDRTPVEPGFPDAGEEEINLLIRAFNRDYTRFINDHFYQFAIEKYRGSEIFRVQSARKGESADIIPRQEDVDTTAIVIESGQFGDLVNLFAGEVHARYGRHYHQRYFHDYVRYSLAELELFSGVPRRAIYREYFMSQPVQPAHPAYMKFFGLFYEGTLTDPAPALREEIMREVNVEKSGTRLMQVLAADSLLLSDQVRALAVIRGLRDAYFSSNYTRINIEACLSEISRNGMNQEIRDIAARTLGSVRRNKGGSAIEDFVLLNELNEPWKWSEHQGMYTYILFFADWCTACKKDMEIMEKLRVEYGRHVRFVAISMDEDYEDFRRYISSHRNQQPVFLFGGNDPLLRQKFGMRAIPHAVLTDASGRIMSDYTRRPSEGIQIEFGKIVKQLNASRGQGTWKD